MAGGPVIRELRRQDAVAVAGLLLAANPDQFVTPELVWHWANRGIEREQRRQWVAELDGTIVGFAPASFEWSVPTPGKGRIWVCVAPTQRGRGLGGALYHRAEEYLRSSGAWRLSSGTDADPAGERFLQQRGFVQDHRHRVSALDPGRAGLPEPSIPAGYRLVPLAESLELAHDLHAICVAGELDMPGDEPETELDFESWTRDDFGDPALSHGGSFVALEGERPVALAFLCVDPARRLGFNLMTATLPEHRRLGLALAVKLACARWAAANGLERILTKNESTNAGMLAINDRLGYRPLYEQINWVLEWERAPRERR
jgi:GNAT superfamily N-acetyltransferase